MSRKRTTSNIEPHGYFTTKPVYMAEMLNFADSPNLRMNMDTGNTFIAGQDPVAFLRQFLGRVSHVHIKDVLPRITEAVRGGMTDRDELLRYWRRCERG